MSKLFWDFIRLSQENAFAVGYKIAGELLSGRNAHLLKQIFFAVDCAEVIDNPFEAEEVMKPYHVFEERYINPLLSVPNGRSPGENMSMSLFSAENDIREKAFYIGFNAAAEQLTGRREGEEIKHV